MGRLKLIFSHFDTENEADKNAFAVVSTCKLFLHNRIGVLITDWRWSSRIGYCITVIQIAIFTGSNELAHMRLITSSAVSVKIIIGLSVF